MVLTYLYASTLSLIGLHLHMRRPKQLYGRSNGKTHLEGINRAHTSIISSAIHRLIFFSLYYYFTSYDAFARLVSRKGEIFKRIVMQTGIF